MVDLSYTLIWMKSTNIFFHLFALWGAQNLFEYIFVYMRDVPWTLVELCRNMGIYDAFRAGLPGQIYPGFILLFIHVAHKSSHVAEDIHNSDVILGAIASQITSVSIVNSTLCSGADQRKHQSSASLAFVRGIHRSPVNSPHKGPVMRRMFPFDDIITRNKKPNPSHMILNINC